MGWKGRRERLSLRLRLRLRLTPRLTPGCTTPPMDTGPSDTLTTLLTHTPTLPSPTADTTDTTDSDTTATSARGRLSPRLSPRLTPGCCMEVTMADRSPTAATMDTATTTLSLTTLPVASVGTTRAAWCRVL